MTNIWNHEKRTISLRLRIASRSDYWSHSNWIIKHYGPWEIWLHLQRMPACFMDRVFLSHKFSSTSTFFTCCRQGLLPTELIFMSHQSLKIYIYIKIRPQLFKLLHLPLPDFSQHELLQSLLLSSFPSSTLAVSCSITYLIALALLRPQAPLLPLYCILGREL